MNLIQNAVYITDKDIYLKSHGTHDFITHIFEDGKEFFIDGGLSYKRVGGDYDELIQTGRIQDYTLTEKSMMLDLHQKLLWGTRGISGRVPLQYRPIMSFTHDHLCAIVKNCPYIGKLHLDVVNYWIMVYEDRAPSKN